MTGGTSDCRERLKRAAAALVWSVFAAAGMCAQQADALRRERARGAGSDFHALAEKAEEARGADRLDEAVSLYRQALAVRPGWAEGWWALGTVLYDHPDYAGAAAAFKRLARLKPKSGDAFAMLGFSEAKLGRNADALRHIRQARSLGADGNAGLRNSLRYNEGVLLVESGAYEQAQETLDALCREGLAEPELILSLGSAVLGIPPSKVAAGDLETRKMIREAGWAEHFAARTDQLPEALREYKRLATDFSKARNVQFAYGRMLLANHYDEEAVEAFRREIENTPSHVLARLGIAGIERATAPPAGLPYAEQAVRLAPGLAEAHYLYGVLLFETGNTPVSIRELETAQRAGLREAKVYFALARAYRAAGREKDAAEARQSFKRLSDETSRPAGLAQPSGTRAPASTPVMPGPERNPWK